VLGVEVKVLPEAEAESEDEPAEEEEEEAATDAAVGTCQQLVPLKNNWVLRTNCYTCRLLAGLGEGRQRGRFVATRASALDIFLDGRRLIRANCLEVGGIRLIAAECQYDCNARPHPRADSW
jgi:hypothetical protein